MPRPKGSKNKKSVMTLEQKINERDNLIAAVKVIEASIDKAKAELKEKKKKLVAAEKAVLKMQMEKETAEKMAAQKADFENLQKLVKDKMKNGVSAKELIEKIKQ